MYVKEYIVNISVEWHPKPVCNGPMYTLMNLLPVLNWAYNDVQQLLV